MAKSSWRDEAEKVESSASTEGTSSSWRDEAEAIPTKEQYSNLESGGLGAVDSASFGFADEAAGALKGSLSGALKTAISKATGKLDVTDQDVKDYLSNRDAFREKLKAAQSENPASYTAGQVGGGLATALIPGGIAAKAAQGASAGAKILQGLKSGAQVGALQGGIGGLGASESDNLTDTAQDVGIGAGVGGALGGAIGGLVPSIGAAYDGVKGIGKSLAKVTGISDDFSRGVEGGRAVQAAENAGATPSAEDLLKLNEFATPEVRQDVIRNAAGDLERGVKLGAQESGDALSQAVAQEAPVDLTGTRTKVLEMVKRAYETGSENEIKQAEQLLKQFDEASGIMRASKEGIEEIKPSLSQAPEKLEADLLAKTQDLDARAAQTKQSVSQDLVSTEQKALQDIRQFKYESEQLKDKATEIVSLANSNQFDQALKLLKSVNDKIGPEASSYLEEVMAKRMAQVEKNNTSETLRKGLLGYKKRLAYLNNRNEKVYDTLFDEALPKEFRETTAQAMEAAPDAASLNRVVRRNVDELVNEQGLSSTPEKVIKERVIGDIDSRIQAQAQRLEQEAQASIQQKQQMKDAAMQSIQEERTLADEIAGQSRGELKTALDEIRTNLDSNPEQSLSILDSVKSKISPEVYTSLKDKIQSFATIPSNRKPMNALDTARALQKFGGEAAELAKEVESLVPNLSAASKQDSSFREMLEGLSINPDKLEGMSTPDFMNVFQKFVKTTMSSNDTAKKEALLSALENGMQSSSEITRNVASSIKKNVDRLAPLLEQATGSPNDPLSRIIGGQAGGALLGATSIESDDSLATKAVKVLGGAYLGKSVGKYGLTKGRASDAANVIGGKVGRAIENSAPTSVEMFNTMINSDGTMMRRMGEALSKSPDELKKKLGMVMTKISDSAPDKRRVLLFSLQQNPEYREILKEMNDKEKMEQTLKNGN